jgi:GT2 family glycosyltransferase/glycosyltransferase involved in cell wall biosynthesis
MRQRPSVGSLKTKAELDGDMALAALRKGEALLVGGDARAARPWLERATRIAPEDDTAKLSLAHALLALGDPGAAPMLEDLTRRHDVREIWLALAGARLRLGDAAGAASALAASLSGHRLPAAAEIADLIAKRAGAAGWCGLLPDETVLVSPGTAVEMVADGVAFPGGTAPADVSSLTVTRAGRHLLGSPLRCDRIRRVEGVVSATPSGIEGWAWFPGDAGREPGLRVMPAAGGAPLQVAAHDTAMLQLRPLTRPRGFMVSAARLPVGALHVFGPDGRELAGSPVDPGGEARAAADVAREVAAALPARGAAQEGVAQGGVAQRGVAQRGVAWSPTAADLAGPPAAAPSQPRRRVAVVVPVYRGLDATLACLRAVFATVPAGTTVIAVDDASPEPALAAALDALAAQGRLSLLRNPCNLGFPGAANAGLRAAAALADAPDVVLLNSDTVPTKGWLAQLRGAVHASPDIGTACPLSNDATILSYPDPAKPAPPQSGDALATLAALAARVHGRAVVDIPTAVGFCMYLRRECLLDTGLFREDLFGQGYGEENDFCVRARHLGWRHVAVPGAYVAHIGGHSFGAAREHLLTRNLALLERLHPGYRTLIEDWAARDPLFPARRALDAARWIAACRDAARAVVLVTHDSGGGVERAVQARCAALRTQGLRPILLRPVVDRSGAPESAERRYVPGLCAVQAETSAHWPNLHFRLPDEFAALTDLLAAARPQAVEVHHLLGHHPGVLDLAAALRVPYDLRVHDYAMICARINLVGAERRYCGEPPVASCAACVADLGSNLEEDIAPAALRARSAGLLAGARSVVVPSLDTGARLRRHFPTLRPIVTPHESDTGLPPLAAMPAGLPRRIGVIGALGAAKGYDVLLACARDAAQRDLALSFTVLGHSEDDARLLDTGRVFITGPYHESDAVRLIRSHALHLAWLPSIWPETWCYVLGEAFRAGLRVAAFDIGAPAERIRATGRGWLLPLGLPPASLNNALLALRTVAGDEGEPSTAGVISSKPRSITARI